MSHAQNEFNRWLAYPQLSEELRLEMLAIADNAEEIELHFGTSMSFGTAGLRSTMNAGPACMNVYTVAQATQGIAALLLQENGKDRGVAIAYDSRNKSTLFAETAAAIFAANLGLGGLEFAHGIPGSVLGALTGAIITERVYLVPGIGNVLTTAINKYDNGVIVGVALFYALLSVTSFILGDVLMSILDPRISFSSKAR